MIVDANLLIYAANRTSPHHESASRWLRERLDGEQRIGLPWQTVGAFLRISTNARLHLSPPSAADAWRFIQTLLDSPLVWMPPATERTAAVYRRLNESTSLTGNLVTDGQLAALAIENGVALYSADTDFARFRELRWINPLTD